MEISATRQDPLPAPRNPVADIVRLTKIWSHLKSHNSQPYLSRHLNLSTVEDVLRKKMVLLNLEDIAHSKDGDATQKEKALDDFERLAEAHATIFQCVNRTCFILKDAVGHRLDILDSLWENKSYNERFELVERLATLILKLPHFEERVSKMIDEQLIALAASDPNDEVGSENFAKSFSDS